MFFLLPLVSVAVGATVGALVTHANSEKDRQAAQHHRQVANDLATKLSSLQERYNEYADKSKSQTDAYTRQHALDEADKDLCRLAIRLQQTLYMLMLDIDEKPTFSALTGFEEAVSATNQVLSALNEESIRVPHKYLSRNLIRVRKREKLVKSRKNKLEYSDVVQLLLW